MCESHIIFIKAGGYFSRQLFVLAKSVKSDKTSGAYKAS